MDGEPDLDTVGNGTCVVIDISLHNDFDDFKDKFQQYTRRGFSTMPQNELIHYWNSNHKQAPLFKCTEIDDLCDWLQVMRENYCN